MPDHKVINKIQKLFARTESTFSAEAESALLKAQELMLKHGLSMKDIGLEENTQEVKEETVYFSQAPIWHGSIAYILAENFRCKSIWDTVYRNNRKMKVITFIGLEEDVLIVKEAYMYAIELIRYNIRGIKKRFPRATAAYINTYIKGFIDGPNVKFHEQVKKENWGLVLVTPTLVEEAYQRYLPVAYKARGKKPEYSNNDNAYQKGYVDGKAFEHDRKRLSGA